MSDDNGSRPIDPLLLSSTISAAYHNVCLCSVNDHEIRLAVVTEQFGWHRHPDSDETFCGIDGELLIQFEDSQVRLKAGQFFTVPAGVLHRTSPVGERCVNLTFERRDATTDFVDR